jgi:hypothetical protein
MTGLDDLVGKEFGGDGEEEEEKQQKQKKGGIPTEDEKEFLHQNGVSGNGGGDGHGSNKNKKRNKQQQHPQQQVQQQEKDEKLSKHSIYKYSSKRRGDLHEAVIYNGLPLFLTYDNSSDKIKVVENIRENNRILRPPDIEEYPYEPYEFAGMGEIQKYVDVVRNVKSVDHYYLRAKDIFGKYNDQDQHIIILLAADAVWSYFQDKFSTTHYNGIVGENGSGKSSIGDTFEAIGYRVVNMTDPSAANIFRVLGNIESGQCSLVIDEADKIDKSPDMMNVLKAGYAYGKKVPKINMTVEKQNFYYPYCIKITLAERLPSQYAAKGVLDRMFTWTVYIGENQYDIKEVQNPQGDPIREELLEELKSFRKEMLIYRLIHFKDPIEDIDVGLKGRNKELCKPTIQLFHGTQSEQEIQKALQKHLDAKNRKKGNSIEASLHPLISSLVNKGGNKVLGKDIWTDIVNGGIEGSYDPKKANEFQSAEHGTLFRNTLTAIICDKFGAERKHGENGTIFTFDPDKLWKVGRAYDLTTKIQTRFDLGHNSNSNNTSEKKTEPTTDDDPEGSEGSEGYSGKAERFDNSNDVKNADIEKQKIKNPDNNTQDYVNNVTPSNAETATYPAEPSAPSDPSANNQTEIEVVKDANNEPMSPNLSKSQPSQPSQPSPTEGALAKTVDNDIDRDLNIKCFYCDQFYESDIKRVKHITDEHPGRLYYPNPEDFENRNIR